MSTYYYKTNLEQVKCLNCGSEHFRTLPGQGWVVGYECQHCHFVSWFGSDAAPFEDEPVSESQINW